MQVARAQAARRKPGSLRPAATGGRSRSGRSSIVAPPLPKPSRSARRDLDHISRVRLESFVRGAAANRLPPRHSLGKHDAGSQRSDPAQSDLPRMLHRSSVQRLWVRVGDPGSERGPPERDLRRHPARESRARRHDPGDRGVEIGIRRNRRLHRRSITRPGRRAHPLLPRIALR